MSQQKIWDYFQSEGLSSFRSVAPRLSHLVRLAARLSPETQLRVLNVGIGDATLERLAVARGWKVYALDPSPEAVKRCVELGIEAHCGRIESMPYSTESLDVVFCSEVFEHLTAAELAAAVPELTRVLRPGGRLVGTVPHAEHLEEQTAVCPRCGEVFHRWGHQQRFTPSSLRDALSRAFDIEHLSVQRFIDWRVLNWKGKGVAVVQKVLAMLGTHGANANVVFVGRKREGR